MSSDGSRKVRLLMGLAVAGLLVPVVAFGYHDWRSGRECRREFDSGSERYEVCQTTGADRAQVCFNLENVPFMCSERFLEGHSSLLAERDRGLARERQRCASDNGVAQCATGTWARWCRANYFPSSQLNDRQAGEYENRAERCITAGPV